MTKTTKVHPKASPERREALKQYILLSVRDSGLSLSDLASSKDRMLKLLSSDVKAVLSEFGAQGGANLLQMGASLLANFAGDLLRKNF